MGSLVDGVWHAKEKVTSDARGRFARAEARFRNWVRRMDQPVRAE